MTKNNSLECWKPKNCGGSSKCGDCITLKFKLLAEWVPYTGSSPDIPSPGILISNYQIPQNFDDGLLTILNKIPNGAKRGYISDAYICKKNINNNTLYYEIADKYVEIRGLSLKQTFINTNKCVNEILIDNSCPKAICDLAKFKFELIEAPPNSNYVIVGKTSYKQEDEEAECEYATDDEELDTDQVLTLTKVVSPSTIEVNLFLNTIDDNPYKKNPYSIDLNKSSSIDLITPSTAKITIF